MKNNLSWLDFSLCLNNNKSKPYLKRNETTYNSSYGNFYSFNNKPCLNNTDNLVNINKKGNEQNIKYLILDQSKNKIQNSKLICPNCINENIVKIRDRSRIVRHLRKSISGYFEDKMKSIHEDKMKKDIKEREERAEKTYKSLFINRGRSNDNFRKIYEVNKTDNREGEYFGNDINYGMLRCRKRELRNDKKIFGVDIRNYRYNGDKSRNYLLDKNEYSVIIDKQMEKNDIRNNNERMERLNEEKKILYVKLNCEKNKIKKENEKKMNIREEMNRINSMLLKEKENKKNKERRNKRREKEIINYLSKKDMEESFNNMRLQRLRYKLIEDDNYKTALFKNRNKTLGKIKERNFIGLLQLNKTNNKKCFQCKRDYPNNVMSQIYYSYCDKQKK